jgi:hypothetical protein
MQAEQLRRKALPDSRDIIQPVFRRADSASAHTASHNSISIEMMPGQKKLALPLSSSPAAFCGWPICPISRSIGSADMKAHFGVKLAESYFPSMRWIGANRKSEGAVSLSTAHKNYRPSSVNGVRVVASPQPVRKPSTVVVARPPRDILCVSAWRDEAR